MKRVLALSVMVLSLNGCRCGDPTLEFKKHGCFGQSKAEFEGLEGPTSVQWGLAIEDSVGYDFYLVCDPPSRRVVVFRYDGSIASIISGDSFGDGALNEPRCATSPLLIQGSPWFDSLRVFVSDTKANKVVQFDLRGRFHSSWGSEGNLDGQLNFPTGIAADDSGFVFVLDSGNNRVQVFDTSGVFIKKWGIEGGGPGEFNGAVDIAVGFTRFYNRQVVVVSDCGNNRIQVFEKSGTFIKSFGVGRVSGVEVIDLGIYAASRSPAMVYSIIDDKISSQRLPNTSDASDVAFSTGIVAVDQIRGTVCSYDWLEKD